MKKRMFFLTRVLAISAMLVCFALTSCQAADIIPPIPPMPAEFQGYKIIQPDPSLGPEIKAFLGEWKEGMWRVLRKSSWSDNRRAKIIVTKVTAETADVLYGRSDDPLSSVAGGWQKITVEIGKDNQGRTCMSLMPPSGYPIKFYVEGGVLKGRQRQTLEFETTR